MCSGPGFFGFYLLGREPRQSLHLTDINKDLIPIVRETIIKNDLHKNLLNGRLTFTDVHGEKVTSFKPKVGDFYIFDSKHQHFVMPVQLKDPLEIRRSLSFNFQIIKN